MMDIRSHGVILYLTICLVAGQGRYIAPNGARIPMHGPIVPASHLQQRHPAPPIRINPSPAIFNPNSRIGNPPSGNEPIPPHVARQNLIPVRTPGSVSLPQKTPVRHTPSNYDIIIKQALDRVNEEDFKMKQRLENGIDKYDKDFDTPDPVIFSESPETVTQFSKPSRIINWISRIIRRNYSGMRLQSVLASNAALREGITCPFKAPMCDAFAKYRTVDGTCNNLQNPLWGSAFIPFNRILPPTYDVDSNRDDRLRSAGYGRERLPNARAISTAFHEPSLPTSDDSEYSMLLTVYGQFIAHDVTDRAPTKGENGALIKCCNQDITTPDGICDNIQVPQSDFFRQFNRACIDFTRSLEVTDLYCQYGQRQQLNQASSYLDGGAVYGATKNKSDSLRRFERGLLMTSVPQQLPIVPHGNTRATMQGFAFYAAGDNRVNEFIGLIAMETVWVREHNRIAIALSGLNPFWNDETLFQETRRIIIAIIQLITYAEYLPAVLGTELIQKYNLHLFSNGHSNSYDERVDPGLNNVFATVAMRFGHSMLRTTYNLLNRQNMDNGYTPIELKDSFFRPQTFLLHEDPLMRGMASDSSKICDRVLSTGVVNHLYQTETGNGMDLAAANIQRSRDHGLADYVKWREHFKLSVPTSFTTRPGGFLDHDSDAVNRLRNIYRNVKDVDVFTAGISERPVRQGAVGPLFGNIIASQFKAIRDGDRYWYETGEHRLRFTQANPMVAITVFDSFIETPAVPNKPLPFIVRARDTSTRDNGQLNEIRKVTLSRVLCNTYNFDVIQERAFFNPNTARNPQVSCFQIPTMNLNAWRI